MYITVQAHEYEKYAHLIDQFFCLRKRVFADTLGWNVNVRGQRERDEYDMYRPVYLFWCDEKAQTLYGGLRLMPTTGPTLMKDVFWRTVPKNVDFCAPGIWEVTRMCIDEPLIAQELKNVNSSQAFSWLLLALCECALEHRIHSLVTNYEPQVQRLYRRAGAHVEELGRAEGYGAYPVCCGIFHVSQVSYIKMRTTMGLEIEVSDSSRNIKVKEEMLADAA